MMITHLVARSLPGQKPFADPRAAWWLMWRMRLAFPAALAACVLPEHTHLITATPEPDAARTRFAKILAVAGVRAGLRRSFERVAESRVLASGRHLERSLRYVHLNPCRAGLVADPLEWPWSTHRGLVGAEVDPWVTPDAIAAALGRPARGLPAWMHGYVSSDPAVRVEGTRLPVPAPRVEIPRFPLEAIRLAALAATPWSAPAVRRTAIIDLALHQGWREARVVAAAAGTSIRTVQRRAALAVEPELALRVCLADTRLALSELRVRPPMAQWRWLRSTEIAEALPPLRVA